MKRGVVYACSHKRWLPETVRSARSCRGHMPDLACQLFITDALFQDSGEGLREIFTDVIVLNGATHQHRPRFDAVLQTDLDEAIFIDGDTLFLAPVHELFEILEKFDIAVALAPQFFSRKALAMKTYDLFPKVSSALPEWNTGVIVARNDEAFRTMVTEWSAFFLRCLKSGFAMDQAAFRSALAMSRLRVATLPNNYNFRANIENNLAGAVKILHAHGDLEAIGGYINDALHMRVYLPKAGEIDGFSPKMPRPA